MNALYTKELWISRRCPAPRYAPQKNGFPWLFLAVAGRLTGPNGDGTADHASRAPRSSGSLSGRCCSEVLGATGARSEKVRHKANTDLFFRLIEPTIPVSPQAAGSVRSLRGKSVQQRVPGCSACQGLGNGSLPGIARGFRGSGHRRTLPRRFSRHRGLGHGRGRRERRGWWRGQGRALPGRGFEGAGAPRQPQCMTLGRLAPRHYAVRRRPRCARG